MDQLHAVRTFYSARHGLVELDDDVLSIVRQVRELYDNRITIHVDPISDEFVFVENCEDGTERLVFATNELDARVLTRLQEADGHSPAYVDAYDRAEREQDAVKAEQDRTFRERMTELGGRLVHGLHKDGVDIPGSNPVFIPRGFDRDHS